MGKQISVLRGEHDETTDPFEIDRSSSEGASRMSAVRYHDVYVDAETDIYYVGPAYRAAHQLAF